MPPTVSRTAVPTGAAALAVAITPATTQLSRSWDAARRRHRRFGADPADADSPSCAREKTKGNVGDVGQLPVGSRLVLAAGLGERNAA